MSLTGDLVHDASTNAPPPDPAPAPEPPKMPEAPSIATIEAAIRAQDAKFLAEAEEWIASVARAPSEITDDAMAAKFAKTISELIKARSKAETIHAAHKAPWYQITKAIDAIFLTGVAKRAQAGQDKLTPIQKRWLLKKEAQERARLAEEARKRDAEAQALRDAEAASLRAAERAMDSGDMERAQEVLNEAAETGKAAVAVQAEASAIENRAEGKVADVIRTHHNSGVTTSATRFWNAELLPLDALAPEQQLKFWQALAPYIGADVRQKAAKAAVKAGLRECPGLRIFEDLNPINR